MFNSTKGPLERGGLDEQWTQWAGIEMGRRRGRGREVGGGRGSKRGVASAGPGDADVGGVGGELPAGTVEGRGRGWIRRPQHPSRLNRSSRQQGNDGHRRTLCVGANDFSESELG